MKNERQYFILIASEQMNNEGETVPASAVFNELVERGKWYLSEVTPFRRVYAAEDRILFYLAGPGHRYFAGMATIVVATQIISDQDKAMLSRFGLYGFVEELPLKDIVVWEQPKSLRALVEKLDFIKDKKNYGLNLRQAAVRISESDYNKIVSAI